MQAGAPMQPTMSPGWDRVLEATARAMIDWREFDTMLQCWTCLPPAGAPGHAAMIGTVCDAMEMFVDTSTLGHEDSLAALIDGSSHACAVFSADLHRIAANPAWLAQEARRGRCALTADWLHPPSFQALRRMARSDGDGGFLQPELLRGDDDGGEPFFLLASSVPRDDGTLLVRLTELSGPADPATDPASLASFGLSQAEARIAAEIAAGRSAEDIAAGRGTALATVRKQIAAILARTGSTSQADLVRRVALARSALVVERAAGTPSWSNPHGPPRQQMGSMGPFTWNSVGPPDGTSILWVHGTLQGFFLPRLLRETAERLGWHLILLQRPGFGDVPFPVCTDEPAASVAAVRAALDVFPDTALAVGFDTGALPLLHLAREAQGTGSRCPRVLAFDVPSRAAAPDPAIMPAELRGWLAMSQVARRAAELAALAARRIMAARGSEWILSRIVPHPPGHADLLQQAEPVRLAAGATEMLLAQGPAAALREAALWRSMAGEATPALCQMHSPGGHASLLRDCPAVAALIGEALDAA